MSGGMAVWKLRVKREFSIVSFAALRGNVEIMFSLSFLILLFFQYISTSSFSLIISFVFVFYCIALSSLFRTCLNVKIMFSLPLCLSFLTIFLTLILFFWLFIASPRFVET